jgi:sugar/nucleoside kinase (ribokinase family)
MAISSKTVGATASHKRGDARAWRFRKSVRSDLPTDVMRPIVSYGELLWDRFPDGERLGGCAANVAFHLAQLGAHALLVSRVGDDELGRRAVRPPFASRETLERALARADAVKLNEAEARTVADFAGVEDLPSWLLQRFDLSFVAHTRGARGSILCTPEARHEVSSSPARGGDRVGAGDAFTAVLALGVSEGWPIPRLVAAANRYAGWVASQSGAIPRPPPAVVNAVIG